MQISHLSLENFRNYRQLELSLDPGPTLLYGDNAQGKTNLLEAIYFLATTRSPHADRGLQLINWDIIKGEEPIVVGRIVAEIETETDTYSLEIRLIRETQNGKHGFRREALVNHRKVRLMDIIGKLRVVLFLPQDIEVITGPPAVRRRYIDIALCQSDPEYCRALSNYNKVLEQRNAVLRQIAEDGFGFDVLPVYSSKLVELGSKVFQKRAQALKMLDSLARRIHSSDLTGGNRSFLLKYFPRLAFAGNARQLDNEEPGIWFSSEPSLDEIADRFDKEISDSQRAEFSSGRTVVGPHRDDWRFIVGGKDLSSFGSRGQQRTALLALKLAEIDWMARMTGSTPVLLLDEVVAELDKNRRELLLNTVQAAQQSILTATDPEMFSSAFLNRAASLQVSGGKIINNKPGGSDF